jgi:hypothetical protein
MADEPKRGPGRPPKVEAAEPKIPRPRISVLERSLQHPFGIPSSPVELKDAGLVCRWVNTELKGGAQFQYALTHGWLQVKPEYLKDPKQVTFTVSPDGFVTKGARNTELLMYTTREHWNERQLAKARENERLLSPGIAKRDTLEAAARHLGEEAADYLQDKVGPVGEVRTQLERIQVDPEPQ